MNESNRVKTSLQGASRVEAYHISNSYTKGKTVRLCFHRSSASTNHSEVSTVVLLYKYGPLRHQFLSIPLSFLTSHRPIILVRNYLEEFNGEFRKSRVLACTMHGLGDPLVLLRRYVCSGRDPLCWVYQEEDEDLSVTRFSGICQVEWLDLVLIYVRECDASVRFRDYTADILHTWGLPDMYIPQFVALESCWCWGDAPIHVVKYSHAHTVILLVRVWFNCCPPE